MRAEDTPGHAKQCRPPAQRYDIVVQRTEHDCPSVSGHTATELKSGDYFGEIAFTATCGKFLRDKSDKSPPEQAVRVADIKATSPCRMLELSVKDFLTILQVCIHFIY